MTSRDEHPAGRDFNLVQIARIKHELGLEDKMPDLYRTPTGRPREHCIAFDGTAHRLICDDDRCATNPITVCGLQWGIHFDQDEVDDDR